MEKEKRTEARKMKKSKIERSFAEYAASESKRLQSLVQTASELKAILPIKTVPVSLNADGTVKKSSDKMKKK